jgi:hypothetical protein
MPVPQRVNFLWGGLLAQKRLIEYGATFQIKLTSCTLLCGTGKMPVLECGARGQIEQILTNKFCILPNAFRRF